MTTTKTILIHKEAGTKKDAIRVNTPSDIPDFLKETVQIISGQLKLTCTEGTETAPLGSVIGYEKSDSTPTGWNTWVIGNASTNLVEKDGVFYKKATIFKASPIVEGEFPVWLKGASVVFNVNGSYSIKTAWGESTGFPGKAYWVLYGKNQDGTPDANILTKTEKSYAEYIVCDLLGNDIGRLSDIDPA